jgi:hypothetical protein
MTEHIRHALVKRLQRIGWVYFTNNFYIENIADVTLPKLSTPLELVLITPQNCARVQDFRGADRCPEYAMKLEQGEVGYFAANAGVMVGSVWATINRAARPIVARSYMRLRPNEALLHDGVTGEKCRGMGVGPFMVGSISVALLEQHGVSRIVGDVSVWNRPSLRMMAKLGLQAQDATFSVSAFGKLIWQTKMRPR